MSDPTPRDDIDGLSERLRVDFGEWTTDPTYDLRIEAANAIDALQARVKELEERVYSPDGRNWARRACDAEELLKDLCKRNHQVTSIAVARLQRIADAEARALRLKQERDEAVTVIKFGLDVVSEERGWGTYQRMEGSEIYIDADTFRDAARDLVRRLAGPEKEGE